VEQIRERLNNRMALLPDERQRTPARHRTVETTARLDIRAAGEPERIVFGGLGGVRRGWSLEAAEAVCSDTQLARSDVLHNPDAARRQSLVSMEEEQGQAHYRLLEPILQYPAAKLLDSADTRGTRQRRATYFCEFG
jgi:predicted ATPase